MSINNFRVDWKAFEDLRSGLGTPVRFGFPLPSGISAAKLRKFELYDSDRNATVAQSVFEPLGFWPDGTVQWVGVDALLAQDTSAFGLREVQTPQDLDNKNQGLAPEVRLESGKLLVRPFPGSDGLEVSAELTLVNRAAVKVFSDSAKLSVKTQSLGTSIGLSASIPLDEGLLGLEIQVNLLLWSTGQIDIQAMVRNPNAAEHPGGNWDLGNKGSCYIQDFSVRIARARASASPDGTLSVRETLLGPLRRAKEKIVLFQSSSGGENWNGSNHLDRERRVPMAFRGFRLTIDQQELNADRATPFLALESDSHTLAIACNRFWQNFPAAIRADNCCIEFGMFPIESGYPHELQGGEQKTFSFAAYHGTQTAETRPLDGYLSEPFPVISQEYLESTSVLPGIAKRLSSQGLAGLDASRTYQKLVDQAIEGADSFFAKREKIDEYGWRNYGDVYGDHEAVYHSGPTPLISHYNNQYDCVLGFCYQFLRSGDPRWYEQMIAMADHAWDIDTYHTTQDKLLYNGGLFWHTYHYADADTGTHRSYPRSLLKEDHFQSGKDLGDLGNTGKSLKKVYGKGGGPAASQNYSTGWMVAYYLTADARYKEAAIQAADYVVRIEDGSKTPFRWLSSGPTGYATCSSDGYYGPGRASANSTLALLTGFELTADRKYLDMAVALMHRTVHPEQNLDRLDLLNAELRWFYTMYLQALCRLIDLLETQPGQETELQYAVASLLHYALRMVANERPILDTPEKLQYPTETWAAQDIRKWHVLAYAARWCGSQQEGQAMLDKAEWFYEYVMRTLDGFETKSLCRPVVLLMNYGWQRRGMNDAFREHGLRHIERPSHWPSMKNFIPQRQIAIQRAKRIVMSAAVVLVFAIGMVSLWLLSGYLKA
jgi:hypothetical protein